MASGLGEVNQRRRSRSEITGGGPGIFVDGGLRYLHGAGSGERRLSQLSSGAFDGPRQWSSVASLGWTW